MGHCLGGRCDWARSVVRLCWEILKEGKSEIKAYHTEHQTRTMCIYTGDKMTEMGSCGDNSLCSESENHPGGPNLIGVSEELN